jgi:Ca-activated chloride channel family protein
MPRHLLVLTLSVISQLVATGAAAPSDDASKSQAGDRTLSPFFVVDGATPGSEAMPLESTHADVHIAGVIANVTVKQTYRNDGTTTISARYVFPASTRAAVYGMKMTIGDRVIVAKIKEKDQAKTEYDAAKREGKTASLLEEQRPNVFTMSVANILPKDRIDVELRYTELLVPTDGTYELVYPTVVGPRYVSERAQDSSFAAIPYTHAGTPPTYALGLDVAIDAGMAIQALESPSHTIATHWGASHTSAKVDVTDGGSGNRDFVLRYRLAGKDLVSGLMLYPGAKENFFLLMVQPPHRPSSEDIVPREYIFIVDVSGSMHGFPLEVSKRLMRDLLTRLRPTDKFDVLLFSGASELYSAHSVEASKASIDDALAFIDAHQSGGGTELLPAMQQAMQLPRPEGKISRSFVVVTDGYIAEEPAVFDHIKDHLGEANVFAFGIGTAVNRHFMEGVAKAGQGEPFIVLDEKEADTAAKKFRAYVESPVLTEVKAAFDSFAAYDIAPKVLPDVFADRPVVVFGKYRGSPSGKITLTGASGRGRFVNTIDASTVTPDASNVALSYLWARARISELSDFYNQDAHKDEVTRLGLEYNLLTRFTSFLAVDQIVRAPGGSTDVVQPSPMPAGVSDTAIGGEDYQVGAEPRLVILLMFLGIFAAWRIVRKRAA